MFFVEGLPMAPGYFQFTLDPKLQVYPLNLKEAVISGHVSIRWYSRVSHVLAPTQVAWTTLQTTLQQKGLRSDRFILQCTIVRDYFLGMIDVLASSAPVFFHQPSGASGN